MMNDTLLLLTGISVFGMMIVAIVMTVVEFREFTEKRIRKSRGSDPEN